ncbi:hypothetical protein Xsto_02556 [Xenorhabdus stockiae]|uniref:DUF2726 domain-containing protein n=1 Tax=Xenorhabdus stockiae TaxID=351614 RepID=A0A2D0KP01_9GAMM|nr:DUF2726 domain-containing protein [Xenorhabdus stockiae]PHM64947.1 hypothetical protein Xsto_02556 [Xenorhabdus stockiae]
MDWLVFFIFVFLIGFFIGQKFKRKERTKVIYRDTPSQVTSRKNYEYRPQKKFKNSRWEDKHELFWSMMDDGVYIKKKRDGFLLTETENNYYKNLLGWFDKNCHVHCQVSLGQLIDFPEQDGFSDEERRRFFTIFNGMAMDFVLVSRKTKKIVCVIELNDHTHKKEERIERDKKLQKLMESAKIPFMPVTVCNINEWPDIWTVRKEVLPEYQ